MSIPTYHRVFIAIPVNKDLHTYIHQTIKTLYPHSLGLRWNNEDTYHITLHYLGSISAPQCELLKNKLASVISKYSSFSLKLEISAGFPSNKPHSLAILIKLSFLLNSLHEETKQIITACNISLSSRPYFPHFTLAKIKSDVWNISPKRLPTPIKMSVQEIQLLQNISIEQQTPQYHKLGVFNLSHHKAENDSLVPSH
ncbi:MAG: RNA 2',3'-cyclic phosphodiesterase [Gammaproteobacteria bacterium]|nr:RNA 2',3'-cyclic phosphodiesterase [Gammaproteobacteria bacterium]